MRVSKRFGQAIVVVWLFSGCDSLGATPALSRRTAALAPGSQVPNVSEREAIGPIDAPITRATPAFRRLRRNRRADIVFKDEEATGADRLMTPRLAQRLGRLAYLVENEWEGSRLRVTEAWDEEGEHGPESAHYEGRAVDLTLSDLDSSKLGRLAFLAVEAGFDWVYFENRAHVHASVRK